MPVYHYSDLELAACKSLQKADLLAMVVDDPLLVLEIKKIQESEGRGVAHALSGRHTSSPRQYYKPAPFLKRRLVVNHLDLQDTYGVRSGIERSNSFASNHTQYLNID